MRDEKEYKKSDQTTDPDVQLHLAAANLDVDAVKKIFAPKPDPNIRVGAKGGMFIDALDAVIPPSSATPREEIPRIIEMATLLLDNGANLNRELAGSTETHLKKAVHVLEPELVDLFLAKGAKVDTKFSNDPLESLAYSAKYELGPNGRIPPRVPGFELRSEEEIKKAIVKIARSLIEHGAIVTPRVLELARGIDYLEEILKPARATWVKRQEAREVLGIGEDR